MVIKLKGLSILLNAHYKDVYRYAFWICKNRSGAEDLVQEAYLQAWNKVSTFKNERVEKLWLFSIVRAENLRKSQRYQPETVEVNELVIQNPAIPQADQAIFGLIQNQIADLDIEIREPLVLQLVGGFSAQEISSILNVKKKKVLSYLYRARKQLKAKLEQVKK